MSIDWKEIWKVHAVNFDGQYAHIPLTENFSFPLLPGAGFGDLSHPTTKLVLSLLQPYVKDKIVVDIGAGSGILSIAAKHLGAKEVYAFEIDEDAIQHAKSNIALNNVKIQMNEIPISFDLVLINMISSEQAIAMEQYSFLLQSPHIFITSGLLIKEESHYLSTHPSYSLIEKKTKGEWLGLVLHHAHTRHSGHATHASHTIHRH